MRNIPTKLLYQVLSGVLEKQAFLFTEPEEPEIFPDPDTEYFCAEMSFSGHTTGELILVVPQKIAIELAANILGEDIDDPDLPTKSLDALKELLNVACGHILSTYAGEQVVFSLSIPKVTFWNPLTGNELLNDPDTLRLSIDDQGLLIRCSINEPAITEK